MQNAETPQRTSSDPRAMAEALFWNGDFRPLFQSLDNPQELIEAAIWTVVERAHRDIERHQKISRVHKNIARCIRISVVVLGLAGGICPLLAKAVPAWDWVLPYGYLFFAVAAAVLVLEEAFGFSSTSLRTNLNVLRLRRVIDQFKLDVSEACNAEGFSLSNSNSRHAIFKLCKKYTAEIDDLLLNDAETWATEFKGRLSSLASYNQSPRF